MKTVYIGGKFVSHRMRNLIKSFIVINAEVLLNMDISEQAEFIAKGVETMVCANYWIKDKRRVETLSQQKQQKTA